MPLRELVYPNYDADLYEGGDIRLRFYAPGSKFGGIHIVLAADDADEFRRLLDKALRDSDVFQESA